MTTTQLLIWSTIVASVVIGYMALEAHLGWVSLVCFGIAGVTFWIGKEF